VCSSPFRFKLKICDLNEKLQELFDPKITQK